MKAIAEYTISAIYDGDSYVIQPSVSSVVIEDSGTYNPSEITFNNKHKQGNGELENYSGRLKIETTSNNSNWTTRYTSSSNEVSKVYSLPSATVDKQPYHFRQSPSGGAKDEVIVGGSLGWNQLIIAETLTDTNNGITYTYDPDGSVIVNGTATANSYSNIGSTLHGINNHVMVMSGCPSGGSADTYRLRDGYVAGKYDTGNGFLWKKTNDNFIPQIVVDNGVTVSNLKFVPQLIDLTTLFGSTIADYIYSLETATAGAGVAWVKRYIDLDTYHEYDAGSIKSVEGLESHVMVGWNQWDEEWEVGWINTGTGANQNANDAIRSKNYIPVIGGKEYHITTAYTANNQRPYLHWYDADKNWIWYTYSSAGEHSVTVTLPDNARYLRFSVANLSTPVAYNHDICINLSDPSRNGIYEPYDPHSYPLDSNVVLRGVPKLVTDHIEFDGDKYLSDGTVERRYGVVDLGTLTWAYFGIGSGQERFVSSGIKSLVKPPSANNVIGNAISFKYPTATMVGVLAGDKLIGLYDDGDLIVRDTAYTDAATFKAAMSGVYLIYELATPTTETAQPFQSPMIVGATEEYVSDSVVPVGHESKYTSDIKNIRASLYKAGGTTALLNQITIPVLSQEDFTPKLINTIRQYTKSTSSTSLPSNPTWVDDEEPTIGDNEYMWARLKHVYSDGTFVYSNAVCSTSISGAIHDVDKANKSITDKVWQSDITTKINQYDNTTVSTIRDRVSTTETDISGIKTRVSDVESETDDLGTRMSTAETTIDQTANNVLIKVTESDTTAAQGGKHLIESLINVAPSGVTISADKVDIEGATIFSSGRLSQTSLNNAYDSKGAADTAKSEAINSANSATDTKLQSYSTTTQMNTAISNAVDDVEANANKTTVPVYYRSTTNSTPSISASTSIGTSNNADNTWTYVMPLPKKNSYFYICEEYTSVSGTKTFSTVRKLDSQTYASKWVSSNDNTLIDGGSIYAHSITSSQLATDAIKSNNYQAAASGPYSVTGTFLDLSNGNFYTPNFGVQSITGQAYLNGEIIAISGSIGDDSGNYWSIGNTIDSQGNGSASIVGNGTAFIQDGDWQIHSGLSNYSNGSINTQWYVQPQGQGLQLTYPYYDGYYYDYGMTSPVLDANSDRFYNQTVSQNFLYIRKHASTIPAMESDWNYIFRVDKDGMIWINGTSLTQMIEAGVDGGAYVPTSGGTITGNLTVTGTLTATASKANQLTHTLSINGKGFDGSGDVNVGTIGAAYGGTGQTSLINSANALINALGTGFSTPVDADYYISQYVGGGTTTTTYHRRPMSALWAYIKSKISSDSSVFDNVYVAKSGDTMTGSLTVENGIYSDSAQFGDLIVTGAGRFTNGLYGNLIGNADTATKAAKLDSTRSFTVGKTSKNVDWSGAVSFSQAEISDVASTAANGWMSKDDKTKLNGIETGAQVNTITGVKGNSETSYRTGNVNITAANIGLGNLTNNKQIKGLASGTTSGHVVTWGSDGYTVADSGVALAPSGNVRGIVSSIASNSDGQLVLTYADGSTSDGIDVEFVATQTSSVQKAEALNVNGTAIGGADQPVYFNNQGKPQTANKIPKLNNATTGGAFYAPTSVGTSGQILKSSGGTPTWVDQSSLSVGSAGAFSSAASVTLTGDTTGTASSTKGWSVATTTKYINSSGRLASPNVANTDHLSKLYWFYASSTMTEDKPSQGDGTIIHAGWDYNGWAGQLYIPNSKSKHLQLRGGDNDNGATVWEDWKTIIDTGNYTTYTVTKTGTGASGTWEISISGTATKATQDGSGNVITSTYVNLTGTQTISGTKTFSATPRTNAICVVPDANGTAGGVGLYNTDPMVYGIAMRTTGSQGKHGFVQENWATYLTMSGDDTRGWIFKNATKAINVASISSAGNAVFNGSVTVGGNTTNTSGCRQEFDSTLQCLNFIFN